MQILGIIVAVRVARNLCLPLIGPKLASEWDSNVGF